MKVLYISSPFFLDMDLSLIQSMSGKADVHYLLDIPVYAYQTTVLDLSSRPDKAGIYSTKHFPEFEKFGNFLDFNKTAIIYRTDKKQFSWSNLKLQKKLNEYVKELKPEIIHLNNMVGLEYLSFFIKNRIPIIQTIHDPFPHSGEYNYRDVFVRNLNNSYIKKKILFNISQKDKYVRHNRLNESDIFTSSLGPYTFLQQESSINEPGKKNHILFFGRISPYKGIDYLVEAVKLVKEKLPDIELTIAGSGKFYFDISEIKNSENFKIINRHISNNELVELLNDNQLILCPYTDATQSGVIMTAYAFYKPVIATNVGGLAEMVQDDITGKLVGARSVEQLANAIFELLSNPEKISEMRDNIKKVYFNGSQSWDSRTNELISIYKEIIG